MESPKPIRRTPPKNLGLLELVFHRCARWQRLHQLLEVEENRGKVFQIFRAIDKKTGAIIHEMALPASTTGVPMTYMVNNKQMVTMAAGGAIFTFTLP